MSPGDEVAGRYRLEELHGRGPMSEVWRAHDTTLDRTVALKILAPTADLERFRREARAVASLGHENVMRVYDYGEDAAGPYMALEWLPGGTLEQRLADGALPAAEAAWIARGMAAGLAHLHSRGFVHRDLKPANVLFDSEERPKLADFGLARSAAGAGTLTEAGTVLGTAAYISPEQAAGEPATPASDVYSFGVVLFRMLTGALPFVANDPFTLLDLQRTEPALPVEALAPEAPPALASLTDAALQKDPAARPRDGAAALAALVDAPALVPLGEEADATIVTPAADRPKPHHALGLVVALFLLAGLGGLLAWGVTRPASAPATGITSTGGVAGAQKSKGSDSIPATSPTTAFTPTRSTSTRAATTSGRTTTTRPTTSATTSATTVPTTTVQPATTTEPATTVSSTTIPTTATTTTTPTTAAIPTTTG